jgi:two-component system sensor histidine kinase YesM
MGIRTFFGMLGKRLRQVYGWLTRTLFRKLLISFFAIITITVSTLGLYYYDRTSSDIKRREIYNKEMLSAQSAANLENKMANIKSAAWNYFADPRFQKFVMTMGTDPDLFNEFSGNFSQFVTDHPEVDFFMVAQLEGNRLTKGNINSTDVVDIEELTRDAIESGGKGVWVPSVAHDRRTGREVRTLTFVQAVKNIGLFNKSPIIGVMMIQLSPSYLSQWLDGIGAQDGVTFLLVDTGTERVALSADPSYDGQRLGGYSDHAVQYGAVPVKSRFGVYDGREVLFVSHAIAKTPWTLVGMIEVRTLLAEINSLARDTIVFGIVCLFGAMLIAGLLSSRLLIPLKSLKAGISAVEKGDYGVILPIRAKDETGYIVHRFNQMAAQTKALIMKVYEADLVRKEAEIKALQSQINPHFLYNTLGVIDSLALMHEDDRISLISRALAKMFRYNISADRMSTLQTELQQLELYLYIQQQRYGDRFRYAVEEDPRASGARVPKLLFQPLVENCFVHAFDRMSADCLLRIRVQWFSGERITVTVWNNGPAIPQDRLAELQAMLAQGLPQRNEPPSRASIGLINVQHRIRLLYGDEYGLEIQSGPEQGTAVKVHLRTLGEEERQ